MVNRLMTNWHLKLLSVVLAFLLWVVVINYDDPQASKTFEGVSVVKMNEEAITSQDKAIEYLDGETVDIVVKGKRSVIDKLTASDINAYADMARVSVTNAIIITVEVEEDVEIVSKLPNEMLISMEDIRSELKTVQVRFEGDLAPGHVKLNEIVTPNQIQVTGPESKLARVTSVVVPIKIDNAEDDVTVFVAPQLLDANGNEVRALTISENQIQVKVPVQETKTVPVYVSTIGELGEDFRLMSIGLSVDKATIRGEAEDLEGVKSLLVDDISLIGLTDGDKVKEISLANYLPENVHIYDPAVNQQVRFDIRPIILATKVVEQSDINVRLIPEGLQFQFLEEDPYTLNLRGISDDLAAVEIENLLPRITLDGLTAGIHEVPLEVTAPRDVTITNEAMPVVTIELTVAPEEGTTAEPEASTEALPRE